MSLCAIHRLRDGTELVCRVQSDLGVDTPHVLCAPVIPRSSWGTLVPKLHLLTEVNGAPHVIVMSQLIALPAREIGPVVGSAEAIRDEIVAAVDLLVSGF